MRSEMPSMGDRFAEHRSAGVLEARLVELERECAEAQDRGRLLGALQQAFTELAVMRSEDDVLATMLRAAHAPLGFSRAIYFAADADGTLCGRFEADRSSVVAPTCEIPDLRPGSAFARVLREPASEAFGCGGELSAPLIDTRNWYALNALAYGDRTRGVLYVDGHPSAAPCEWEVGLVRALATITAVALEGVALLAETQQLATRDPLTGLFNRRTLAERLQAEIETARRYGRSVAYVLIDVDDFKAINDAHGHAFGDAVLQKLALTLQRNSRPQDVVARYAGDEFVVVFVDVETMLARALVERLSLAMREAGLRCSLGAALLQDDAGDAATLMARADRALYATKARGKNGFSFATTSR